LHISNRAKLYRVILQLRVSTRARPIYSPRRQIRPTSTRIQENMNRNMAAFARTAWHTESAPISIPRHSMSIRASSTFAQVRGRSTSSTLISMRISRRPTKTGCKLVPKRIILKARILNVHGLLGQNRPNSRSRIPATISNFS
jgi:hypothetical protein